MSRQILVEQLSAESLSTQDYVVFGGTFDPIHQGHLGAIRKLLKDFRLVIIAPTTENPWKPEPPTPLSVRLEMIELVLRAESRGSREDSAVPDPVHQEPTGQSRSFTKDGRTIEVYSEGYQYAEQLVRRFQATRAGTLYWAVGADIAAEVANWKDWDQFNVTSVVVPIVPQLHASDIRDGRAVIHPALSAFVRQHSLYQT